MSVPTWGHKVPEAALSIIEANKTKSPPTDFLKKLLNPLIPSLVPVSIPSKDTESNRTGLYIVSVVLFSLECLFVLLLRHFYHFEAYRVFYGIILLEKLKLVDTFDFDTSHESERARDSLRLSLKC